MRRLDEKTEADRLRRGVIGGDKIWNLHLVNLRLLQRKFFISSL